MTSHLVTTLSHTQDNLTVGTINRRSLVCLVESSTSRLEHWPLFTSATSSVPSETQNRVSAQIFEAGRHLTLQRFHSTRPDIKQRLRSPFWCQTVTTYLTLSRKYILKYVQCWQFYAFILCFKEFCPCFLPLPCRFICGTVKIENHRLFSVKQPLTFTLIIIRMSCVLYSSDRLLCVINLLMCFAGENSIWASWC